MRHTKRKPEIKIGHLMLCKACELSERVKSRSPESNILEEHREEKKPGPESRRGIRVQRRGMEVQTTEKGNQKRRKTRERETVSGPCFLILVPDVGQSLFIYLGGVTGHSYPEEVHGRCHASHHEQQQAMAGAPVHGQPCLWTQSSNIRPQEQQRTLTPGR